MSSNIHAHITSLQKLQAKLDKTFPSYIHHIRFPRYKNISDGSRIDFNFPVTALVGVNGSGKTSVLNALYGAPARYSTGDYWFSTQVDPIVEGDGSPNRFIYGYYNAGFGGVVETRKARVRKVRQGQPNPNYWEPTKESTGDLMSVPSTAPDKAIGRSADRWNPVERDVLYINFRRELSAFDKFFYFGRAPNLRRLKTKSDLIERDAGVLKRIIDAGNTSTKHYGKKVATENRLVDPEELAAIRRILGRHYTEARLIRHSLFRGDRGGLSVLFQTKVGQYSEAFAGSGEVAVTSCVVQVSKAQEGTLVLLDEPEVSLHPAAEERLLEFLVEASLRRKLQIVFSTHSPSMIAPLPDDAIKVFVEDAAGTFSIIPRNSPYAAFRRLGAKEGGEITIVTEDRLGASIVKLALLNLDAGEQERFRVECVTGGADALLKYRVPVFMHSGESVFFFLDGDKKHVDSLVDPNTIPASADDTLAATIKTQFNVDPTLSPDGSSGKSNAAQSAALRRKYLAYAREHVAYLPCMCPEEIVLRAVDPKRKRMTASLDAKQALKELVVAAYGEKVSSEDIDSYGKAVLAQQRAGNVELKEISDKLSAIATGVRPRQ